MGAETITNTATSTNQPHRRIAWWLLFAVVASLALWALIFAALRWIF